MVTISGINAHRQPLREHVYHKASDLAASLQVGDVIEVEVLEVLGNNSAVLDIRGSAVLAETPGPLLPGTLVRTRVEQVSPRLILMLLRGSAQYRETAEAFLRTHLPERVPLSDLLPQLVESLPALRRAAPELAALLERALERGVLSSKTAEDPTFLQSWLKTSGLLLESKLARALESGEPPDLRFDLKAILLRLAGQLEEGRPGGDQTDSPLSPLLSDLRAYLKNIELEQFRNVQALADGRSVYLQLPWGVERERAELFLRRWGEDREPGQEREGGFRICFLLSLRGLGDLRIDATLDGKRVGCSFQVANPDCAPFLRGRFPRLKERLEAHGFQVVRLDCVEVQQTPRADEEGEVLDFGLRDRRLIDVKA